MTAHRAPSDAGGEILSEARLREIEGRVQKATGDAWFWNSYSQIGARVPSGHPLEYDDGLTSICWIDQGPGKHYGDSLTLPESIANADFITESRADVPALLASHRALTTQLAAKDATLAELRKALEKFANPNNWRTEHIGYGSTAGHIDRWELGVDPMEIARLALAATPDRGAGAVLAADPEGELWYLRGVISGIRLLAKDGGEHALSDIIGACDRGLAWRGKGGDDATE